jgi:hypothetical protein
MKKTKKAPPSGIIKKENLSDVNVGYVWYPPSWNQTRRPWMSRSIRLAHNSDVVGKKWRDGEGIWHEVVERLMRGKKVKVWKKIKMNNSLRKYLYRQEMSIMKQWEAIAKGYTGIREDRESMTYSDLLQFIEMKISETKGIGSYSNKERIDILGKHLEILESEKRRVEKTIKKIKKIKRRG